MVYYNITTLIYLTIHINNIYLQKSQIFFLTHAESMQDHQTKAALSFSQLYEAYQPQFVRFANTYVRDYVVAEDVTTEALIYYWENRAGMKDETNVAAYILTVIKHKCLNYLRHVQIRDDYSASMQNYARWELNTRISTLEACEPNELFAAEIQEIVNRTLAALPEQTRKIFIQSRYENKSHKEIAEHFRISPKGVEFHINKALKALRISLKDYFPLFIYLFMK